MPQALLVYADTNNLGDEIQSVAVQRFLSKVDSLVDRDSLSAFTPADGTPRRMVLNGWYSGAPENWPPSRYIDPLILSMHVSWSEAYRSGLRAGDVMLREPVAKYLRHYGPVGARDRNTMLLLKRADIDSYFSGCVTLTLPRSTGERDEELLVLNDVPPPVAAQIKSKTKRHVVETSHAGFPGRGAERRFQKARELLHVYKTAGCVITSRLHCALPSIAMGTPTLLLDVAGDQYRFEGLHELVHHCSVKDFQDGKANFDPEDPPPPLDRHFELAASMTERIETFASAQQGTGLAYPLNDHDLIESGRSTKELLIQRVDRYRQQQREGSVACGKLIESLRAFCDLDPGSSLTAGQRDALVSAMKAADTLQEAQRFKS